MELPHIGSNCSVKMCQQLDFLPIKCEFCAQVFCQEHNLPHNHDCPKKPESICIVKEGYENDLQYKYQCSLTSCKNKELTPVSCEHCLKNFCLKHRHQVDHDCTEYSPPKNPMAEAASKIEALMKDVPSKPKERKTKNEKLAAKIQLMKLKSKASGKSGIPTDERVYFSVLKPRKLMANDCEPLSIFVSHHQSVGRAIDDIAEIAKVSNNNNKTNAPQLALFQASDMKMLTPLSSPLKDLISNDEIYNGQSLALEYVDS